MKRAAAVRPPLFLGLMTRRLAYGKKQDIGGRACIIRRLVSSSDAAVLSCEVVYEASIP